MKIIYAVVNHKHVGQVDVAYTSEEKAYRELKKLIKEFIEDGYGYEYQCDSEGMKKIKRLLRKKLDDDVLDEINNILCEQDYEYLKDDFYILPIYLNP